MTSRSLYLAIRLGRVQDRRPKPARTVLLRVLRHCDEVSVISHILREHGYTSPDIIDAIEWARGQELLPARP